MQTESQRKAIVAEVYGQPVQDRRRFQAMRDTLSDQARRATSAAYSDNTRRAYVQAWDKFCEAVGPSRSMPATPELLGNYLVLLAEEEWSVATVRLAAAAISTANRAADVENTCIGGVVKMALEGISCQQGQPQVQASALDAAALDAIRSTAMLPRTECRGVTEAPDYAVCRGQVDIAFCSVLSDGGLRRSVAAALTWGDLEIAADESGRVRIARSKTDQEGKGRLWRSRRRRCRRWRRSATTPAMMIPFSI